MRDEIFIYGTLHPQVAPEDVRDVVREFVSLGLATMRGTLHRISDYPGLTLEPAEEDVAGEVFALPEGREAEIWQRLDEYEGYSPGSEATSTFVRQLVQVTMVTGEQRRVWVYLYNG